jgi:hypothetical protein
MGFISSRGDDLGNRISESKFEGWYEKTHTPGVSTSTPHGIKMVRVCKLIDSLYIALGIHEINLQEV